MGQRCEEFVLAAIRFSQAGLTLAQRSVDQLLFCPRSVNRFFGSNPVRDVANDRQAPYRLTACIAQL